MSGDRESKPRQLRPWIPRLGLWLLAVVAVSGIVGLGPGFEIPVRVLLGWIPHTFAMVPPLLPRWREALFPLLCLAAALFLAHRFLRWYFAARGRPATWKATHTTAVFLLLLLGSAAAIAMSGIAHQAAWLRQTEIVVTRGRNVAQTVMMNQTREIMIATVEFSITHDRYPHSLSELESSGLLPAGFSHTDRGKGYATEPFLLLRPGEIPDFDQEIPVILSPMLEQTRKYVVGLSSGACTTMPERKVLELLDGLHSSHSGPGDEK